MWELIIYEIEGIVNRYFIFLIIAIGLFSYFVDAPFLEQEQSFKEEKMAKGIGITYTVLGTVAIIISIIIIK